MVAQQPMPRCHAYPMITNETVDRVEDHRHAPWATMGHCVPHQSTARGGPDQCSTPNGDLSNVRPTPCLICNPGDAFDQLFGTVASIENRSWLENDLSWSEVTRAPATTGRQREKLDAITRSIDAIDARCRADGRQMNSGVRQNLPGHLRRTQEQLDAHFKSHPQRSHVISHGGHHRVRCGLLSDESALVYQVRNTRWATDMPVDSMPSIQFNFHAV